MILESFRILFEKTRISILDDILGSLGIAQDSRRIAQQRSLMRGEGFGGQGGRTSAGSVRCRLGWCHVV
jgi:hypothetical protein